METSELTKVCPRCGRDLPLTDFSFSKKSKDGRQSYCKDCAKETSVESQRKRAEMAARGETPIPRGDVKRVLNAPVAKGRVYSDERLAGFTPRQLIEELRQRGFTGKLSYTMNIDL